MQVVGRDSKFQKNVSHLPGTGVVTSGGVYRMLTGKMWMSDGHWRTLGLKGRIALPLVVPHSGKTAMTRFGYSASRSLTSTSLALRGGAVRTGDRAMMTALSRPMRWTLRVSGYEMVKMGSKMAAR